MCFLVILGLLMRWLSERDRGLSDGAEAGRAGTKEAVPPKAEASGYPSQRSSSASSLSPLPDIPEIYLLPQLIPVKGDGLPAVAEAERVVRSRR